MSLSPETLRPRVVDLMELIEMLEGGDFDRFLSPEASLKLIDFFSGVSREAGLKKGRLAFASIAFDYDGYQYATSYSITAPDETGSSVFTGIETKNQEEPGYTEMLSSYPVFSLNVDADTMSDLSVVLG